MVSGDHLKSLVATIERRTLRLQDAARQLTRINSNNNEYSDALSERLRKRYSTIRESLLSATEELNNVLASPDVKLVETECASTSSLIVNNANQEYLRFLSNNPKCLYSLRPRAFEETVAGIFSDLGYNVELTPLTHDGGKDLILRSTGPIGSFVAYVQCKQYSPFRPVGIETVRELFGVQQADQINKGLVVTTSYFSGAAIDYARSISVLLSLKNYDDIMDWLQRYK